MTEDRKTIKLCDFGVSHHVDKTRQTQRAMGTLRFMSPELLDGKLSNKADVWAIGCVLLQFITGVLPFSGEQNEYAIMSKVISKVTPLDYAKMKL